MATRAGHRGVKQRCGRPLVLGWPEQDHVIRFAPLRFVDRQRHGGLELFDARWMQQATTAVARIITAAEQQPAAGSTADADAEITIGEPQFRLVVTAEHRQSFRPCVWTLARHQLSVKRLDPPESPTPWAQHHQGVELLQQCIGLVRVRLTSRGDAQRLRGLVQCVHALMDGLQHGIGQLC